MKNLILPIILLFVSALLTFTSCQKDPEIITETVVVVETDTVFINTQNTDTLVIQITDTISLTTFVQDTATTFILIRHAEDTGSGNDPTLSSMGEERVEELNRLLENVDLNGVYSTNFNRTKLTAQPIADEKGLSLELYNAFNSNALADEILQNHHSGAALVVGHSNTIPMLLNVLTGTNSFNQIPETEYDNLFVVSVFEKGRAEVVHLKYGE